jgi:hypothetical protein
VLRYSEPPAGLSCSLRARRRSRPELQCMTLAVFGDRGGEFTHVLRWPAVLGGE